MSQLIIRNIIGITPIITHLLTGLDSQEKKAWLESHSVYNGSNVGRTTTRDATMQETHRNAGIKIARIAVLTLVGICGTAEILTRMSGLCSVPVYKLDEKIQYIPQPNQQGTFLRMNDWCFNNLSMPTCKDWHIDNQPSILLIGNSVIMGGNVYPQKEKLTPLIEKEVHDQYNIWPLATGGWTQENEIAYLDAHPEITQKYNYFAWEYMAGGLSNPSPWPGEYVFPTHIPFVQSVYFIRRYIVPVLFSSFDKSELPLTGNPLPNNVQEFEKHVAELTHYACSGHGLIWLYPTQDQLEHYRNNHEEWLPERKVIQTIARKYKLEILDISQTQEWRSDLYRKDRVHPSIEGNHVLSEILAKTLNSTKIGNCTNPS